METRYYVGRQELLGKNTQWRISDMGVAQVAHDYPLDLLQAIRDRAVEIKDRESEKRHLDLRYIRDAQRHIPEIEELVQWPGRIEALSELAGTQLEPYPFSVISTAVTFMGPQDGTVGWHGDGVPVNELVALEVDDVQGGELAVYAGDFDEGFEKTRVGVPLPEEQMIRLQHEVGSSMVGQLMRVLHRTDPMTRGSRVTINMGLRSVEKPYIDDNPMYYLAADNPSFDWVDEYVADVRERQLPAYMASHAA